MFSHGDDRRCSTTWRLLYGYVAFDQQLLSVRGAIKNNWHEDALGRLGVKDPPQPYRESRRCVLVGDGVLSTMSPGTKARRNSRPLGKPLRTGWQPPDAANLLPFDVTACQAPDPYRAVTLYPPLRIRRHLPKWRLPIVCPWF